MLDPSLELSGDDFHGDELLTPFAWILTQVLVGRHAAAEGTWELIDDNIDHCPIQYFGVAVQSINFVQEILDCASLPEFIYLQVCS